MRIVPVAALLLALTPAARAEDAAHGRKLFMTDGCYECHGTVGQGGAAAPRIAPDPMDAQAIAAYVRRPAGQMPPYSAKVLSDADIGDIHAYLASIRKPEADVGRLVDGPGPKR
jgi:mono/diheme cytochrome c family protein